MALPFARLISLLTPRRAWFQFRLRTLFVLVAVAAVPCSWLTWKIEQKRREREAIAAIREHGGNCHYRWEVELKPHPPGPEWLRRLFGDNFFTDVDGVQFEVGSPENADTAMNYVRGMTHLRELSFWHAQLTDVGLKNIQGLTMLKILSLQGTHITDDGLKYLERLTRLEKLDLGFTEVTDTGLGHLQGLTKLKELFLNVTHVTDDGLKHLEKSTRLEMLNLDAPQVTDVGLKHLYGLTGLKRLTLNLTQTTDAGVSKLQKALPNCNIER